MHAPVQPPIPPETLLLAYRSGIFPMADERDDPEIFWVEPRMRAILPLDGFHCSRSLAKTLRQDRYEVTCNTAFDRVIAACAQVRPDHPGSWISHRIEDSYNALHRAGHAHSLECWRDGELVGGLYGVAFDRVFCGESMFSRADNASKVALAWLVVCLRHAGGRVLDCQFMTDHLASLGAIEMTQGDYLALVRTAQDGEAHVPDGYSSVLSAASSAAGGVDSAVCASSSARAAATSSSPGKYIAQFLTHTS